MPAGLLDETPDHAEAKPGAAPFLLRREERIEGMGHDIRRHAGARIGQGQHHILPRGHLHMLGGIRTVEIGIARLDGELAAFGHGVARVDGHVEDGVLDLGGIDEGVPEPAGDDCLDLDMLAEAAPQHVGHLPDQPAEVEGHGAQRLAP